MTAVVTPLQSGRGTGAPVRRRKRRLTFDRVSFVLVFLGLPLAIYVVFVVSPFLQAVYYSLTDWSGFTSTQNFVGIRNYTRVLTDSIFLHAMRNNILLVVVLPLLTGDCGARSSTASSPSSRT
jgi:N-acetylglucosamine transport system permease protein